MTTAFLDGLFERGVPHGSLVEFAASCPAVAPALPHIIEAGWNCEKSGGLFTWMGKHENAWEDDPGTLAMAWKSRAALRQCEQLAADNADRQSPASVKQLDEAWALQLLAESSDPLGWRPLAGEARFGRAAAEIAWRVAAGLLFEWETQWGVKTSAAPRFEPTGVAEDVPKPRVRGEGDVSWWRESLGPICAVKVKVGAGDYGVEFPLLGSAVAYSPSGLEKTHHLIDVSRMPAPVVHLPLANGLIGIGDSWYVIRLNEWGQPCVRLSRADPVVFFCASGLSTRKSYEWRFLLYRGTPEEAVTLANRANRV